METGLKELRRRSKNEVVGNVEILEVTYYENPQWLKDDRLSHIKCYDYEAIVGEVKYIVNANGCKNDIRTSELKRSIRVSKGEVNSDCEWFETYKSWFSIIAEYSVLKY